MTRSHLPRAALLAVVLILGPAGSAALAQERPIRVGMIPDAGATQISTQQKAPLRDYLAKASGLPVELLIPTNYNATVEALGNGSLDIAYLGGLTYIKARARYGVVPLVQRDSDLKFHSLFITQAGSPIRSLADLKGRSFAFGDIESTSGHLMPVEALLKAGIDPERDLKYRYSGSHPATAKAVEAGVADAGALDESVFGAMIESRQLDAAKLRVFHTTPDFVDYVWVARKDLAAATRDKIAAAFLDLSEGRDESILAILRGRKFVPASDASYDTLRRVAAELKLF